MDLLFERRDRGRQLTLYKLLLRVLEAGEHTALMQGRVIQGEALDVSSGGLRIHLLLPVPKAAEVELWVETPDAGTFLLSCEVRWLKHSDRGGYEIGVLLRASATEQDRRDWQALFS